MSKEPVLKMVAFLQKRPDLSLEEFEHYYETRHVPLVLTVLPNISRYVRNYVKPDTAANSRVAQGSLPPCDVVTELWFDTEDDHQKFQAACSNPEVIKKLSDDEMNFMDVGSVQTFMVRHHGGEVVYQ